MRKNGVPEKIGTGKGSELPRPDMPIPFLAGRPQREAAIDQDDLTNLQIAFYTCKDLADFILVT